jgi:2-keto-4-pentenoate hydratase
MTSVWRNLAETLAAEHRALKPFRPFAADNAIKTIADAYAAQREYVLLRQDKLGSERAGYKIGLTSKAMQAMCGIDTPVSGIVFADHVLPSPARLQRSQHGRLGLEFEIAVRMGKDLRAPGATLSIDQVADAVDGVSAAIELVDDRNCDYATLDVLSLIADNAWNAGIVLGAFATSWPDLARVQGIVSANGAEIGRGVGADALGHPFVPLAWLANQVIRDGSYLRAGDIIMTGSLIKTQFPAIATHFDYELKGIGQVSCHVV